MSKPRCLVTIAATLLFAACNQPLPSEVEPVNKPHFDGGIGTIGSNGKSSIDAAPVSADSTTSGSAQDGIGTIGSNG